MAMVAKLLLKFRHGLPQGQYLLLAFLVLMEPVRNLIRTSKHVRTALVIQLGQRGHYSAHAVLQHLVAVFSALRGADAVRVVIVARTRYQKQHGQQEGRDRPSLHVFDLVDPPFHLVGGTLGERAQTL